MSLMIFDQLNGFFDSYDVIVYDVLGFAERIGTRIVGVIPADLKNMSAASCGGTVVEIYNKSRTSDSFRRLYETVARIGKNDLGLPRPLESDSLKSLLEK